MIELSGEERAELERRVACYTLPHKVVVRAKMILYAAEGQPTAEIARRLETAPRVVGRWRKRFFEERLAGLEDRERAGRPRRFPPEQVAEVKALACELPATHGLPLRRFSRTELHRLVVERGLSEASASTIWRWLHDDALKPWQQRSWIFVRDPLRREGRPGARPLPAPLRGPPPAPGRVRDLRRREVATAGARPSARALPPRRVGRHGSSSTTGATARSPTSPAGMSTTPTCSTASRRRPGSSRSAAGRAGDERRAVLLRVHRLLDRRQRQLPRRPGQRSSGSRAPAANAAADPPPDPRLLAQPDRALLLDRPTQSAHPQRLPLPRRARRAAARASASTTARSRGRSSGRSPAPTSTDSSPESTPTSPHSQLAA